MTILPVEAHEDDVIKKLPPTKAKPDLRRARALMDAAKRKLTAQNRFACCIQPPPEARAPGCDWCVREVGSCACGINLMAGKGVCGECVGGWRDGRGTFRGVQGKEIKLLDATRQKLPDSDKPIPEELVRAREVMNQAKRTLVQEGRFTCCIGKGGCDECAYEAACPCGRKALLGKKGDGVCAQCYDSWHAGNGRLQGVTAEELKIEPMEMIAMTPFAGLPVFQEASGTAWQPAASLMYAEMRDSGRFGLMAHYNANLNYTRQEGPRGDYQFNALSSVAGTARRAVGSRGQLLFRGMLSLDPLLATPAGYPSLLQTGESYGGRPLVDRQHPHDFFKELGLVYRYRLAPDSAAWVYLAAVGEPALGPVAYPHRLSAMDLPMAPLGHHWQDSTHIAFGAATVGIWKRNVQLEASVFTGREPDEHRWNFDTMRFDSYAARLTWNPGPNWSMQASYGFLRSPEELHAGEDKRRTTASLMYVLPRQDGGFWAATFAYGRNSSRAVTSDSFLLETSLNLAQRNTLFARLEHVQKPGEDLNVLPEQRLFGVSQFTFGAVHDFTPRRAYQTGIGAAVTLNVFPNALESVYGNSPMGYWVFFRVRPAPMRR
jgi:hypothetical protein